MKQSSAYRMVGGWFAQRAKQYLFCGKPGVERRPNNCPIDG